MYVDGGSLIEFLYEHCFNRLWPKIKSQLVPSTTSLTSFSRETIWSLGQLRLLVTIGDAEHFTKAWMNFMIVRSPSPYNGIIGRPGIREIQAVPSTAHGMLKFPVNDGVVTIRSTIMTPNECATITATSKDSIKKIKGGQENLKVAIHPDFLDQEVALGGMLSIEGKTALCALLKRNLDIFAWQPFDMTGVPRHIAEHRLNIRDGYPSVQQKKRGQAPERAKAIQAEVQKLVEAWIMREVYYHDWLSNPVMGYHHIQMAKLDEEKTAFHTPHRVYCYTKMSFGLKNARATYQWLVDKVFEKQVGQNLEVYIDDLVIKSHTEAELLRDIEETFCTLRKINMKLNPKKCTFGAVEGMFLGYMVGPKGIKPCPEKIEAVLQLPSPRTIKEVQSLNGKLAGLKRDSIQTSFYFVSRALQGPELKYTPMEKLVLALVFAAKRLRSIMLGEHNITYRPRTSVKGQILADLLVEKPEEASVDASEKEAPQEPWTLFTDGSSCIDGSGAGLILTSPNRAEFTYVLSVDSKLVANQVLGTYIAKEENMIKYLEKVLVEVLQEKSIQEKEVADVVEEEGPTWMTPITEYLIDGVLPDDKKEANKLRIKARQYELMDGIPYRHLFLRSWLRDAWDMILKCKDCQVHRPVLRNPQQPLTPITSPWPFYKWRIDIAGPFPEGPGKVKFLIVAMDYFTK
ncbi:reverse transcriptase domain-containing protein [Tanacetum coccineum]